MINVNNALEINNSAYVSADGIEEGLLLFDHARTEKEKRRAAVSLDTAWEELQAYKMDQNQYGHQIHFAKERAYSLLAKRIVEIQEYNW